ncbi:MAG TPA: hypothetical protein VEB66_05590 [Opitutaceae bacterium]|nr:hypothetical protein [Opitutaceae bacterium]
MFTKQELINYAQKSVPSFKWVSGAAALLAMAAVVLEWGVNVGALALVGLILLAFAIALLGLKAITRLKPGQTSVIAVFMTWAFMLTMVAFLAMGVSSAAIDRPWPARTAIARLFEPPPDPDTHGSRRRDPPPPDPSGVARIQYDFLSTYANLARPDEILRLAEAELVELAGGQAGLRATFEFTNTWDNHLVFSPEAKFFVLRNNRGDLKRPHAFDSPPVGHVLGLNQSRTVTVTFEVTDWLRKDSGVTEVYFEAIKFTPFARAGWKFRLPRAAAG